MVEQSAIRPFKDRVMAEPLPSEILNSITRQPKDRKADRHKPETRTGDRHKLSSSEREQKARAEGTVWESRKKNRHSAEARARANANRSRWARDGKDWQPTWTHEEVMQAYATPLKNGPWVPFTPRYPKETAKMLEENRRAREEQESGRDG